MHNNGNRQRVLEIYCSRTLLCGWQLIDCLAWMCYPSRAGVQDNEQFHLGLTAPVVGTLTTEKGAILKSMNLPVEGTDTVDRTF